MCSCKEIFSSPSETALQYITCKRNAIITARLHVPIVGPTGRSDWSVRLVGPTMYRVNASFDRSDRRSDV